jgi:hypothetical protein
MFKQWQKSIGLVGIILLLSSCVKPPDARDSDSSPNPVTSPNLLPTPKGVWMTEFKQLNGTPYLYAPIYVADKEQKSILKQIKSAASSSDYSGRDGYLDIRNYMFVHRDNLSAGKLLPTNNSRLLELEQIGEPAPVDKSNPDPNRANWIKTVKTLWYTQVLADTNGDKELSNLDRKQIAISDVSGANYTEIIKNIDAILLVYPKGLDRRLVFYTSDSKHFVADVDIPNRKATIKQLPALE